MTPQSVPAAGLVTAGEPPKTDSRRIQDDCVDEVLRAMAANSTQLSPSTDDTTETHASTPMKSPVDDKVLKTPPGNFTRRTPGLKTSPVNPRQTPPA